MSDKPPEGLKNAVKVAQVVEHAFHITVRRYQQLAKDGTVPSSVGGYIDFLEATRSFTAYQKKLIDGSGAISLTDERTRLTKIQADRKQIQLMREQGELIVANLARRVWSGIMATYKSRMESLPRKLAPLLLGCEKIPEIQDILQREIDAIRVELSEPDLQTISVDQGLIPHSHHRKRTGVVHKAKAKAVSKRVGGRKPSVESGGKR
ncbi:MAG: hypothetical protein ABSB79_07635 [Syntrophales bacterium]|jgi:phage terminase Nu1 subunit (DNA packaging protein)